MPTFLPNTATLQRERKWYVIDARGQVLGKLAALAARVLTGKHTPQYTPFLDTGDHVIVINAAQVAVTGRKESTKVFYQHSGYLGGMKSESIEERRAKHPERLVEEAVRGMLPKTRLGRAMFLKLKVYADAAHPHQAQKPKALAVK